MANPWKEILNDRELEIFSDILSQTQVIKEKSKEFKKVRSVVPIREWVESEYYVGPAGMGLYPFWKSKLIEVFDEKRRVPVNEVIVTGGLGCRPISSLYQTDYGVLGLSQIKSLIRSNVVSILSPSGLNVRILDVHYVGIRDILRVKFNTGYIMEATLDHRIKVLVDGKVVWKRFDELILGDKVIKSNRQEPLTGCVYEKHNIEKSLNYFHKVCRDKDDIKLLVAMRASLIFPVDIVRSRCYCGDIEVEGHEYVNEGVIQHNTGKSTFGLFCIIRKIYELSCYSNIPALFNLMPGTFISFMYFTVSRAQAEITGYGQIKSIIDSIPYFLERFPRNDRLQSMLVFPEKLLLMYGSSQMHSIGLNMIGSILDEANFFQGNAQSVQKSAADYTKIGEMYAAIVNRSKSRFKSYKRDASLSVLISSNTTSSSFTEKRIAECEGQENALIINSRVWDVKPKGTYSDKVFYVFTGSDLLDPSIVSGIDDIYQYTDSIDVPRPEGTTVEEALSNLLVGRDKFVEVPEDFRKQYEDNIIMSLQDISGLSVAPSGRLFSSRPLYKDACNTVLFHPFYKAEIVISTHDKVRVSDYLNKSWSPRSRHKKRFIHIDQSTTNDSTGFASSYIDRYVKDEVTGIFYPVVVTELMVRINPPKPPKKISIAKVRDFVFYLRDIFGLEIGWVSYDQFQSSESLQTLEENDIPCGLLSVDRDDVPYLTFVQLFYEHRIETYRYPPAEKELFEVIHYRDKNKVDHPDNGCFTGDTKIKLLNGEVRSMKELDGRTDFYVYGCLKDGTVVPALARKCFKTKTVNELVEVELDNGEVIRCTLDHRFMMRDGSYREAQSLNPMDSCMPLYYDYNGKFLKGYERIYDNKTCKWRYTHAVVDEYYNGKRLLGYVVHHYDLNKLNNEPENLERLTKEEHGRRHMLISGMSSRPDVVQRRVESYKRKMREKSGIAPDSIEPPWVIRRESKKLSHDEKVEYYKRHNNLESIRKASSKNITMQNTKGYWVSEAGKERRRELAQTQLVEARLHRMNIEDEEWISRVDLSIPLISIRQAMNLYGGHEISVSRRLKKLGVDFYQGYLKVKDMTNEELKAIGCSKKQIRIFEKQGNHKVVGVRVVKCKPTEVYDIEVPGINNFALAAGIFVHNSKDILDAWVGSVYNAIIHTKDETPVASSTKESGLVILGSRDDVPYDVNELVQGEL